MQQQESGYIYLRGLRQADHTVFCVQEGQKTYFDPRFNRRVAYSSGQQVKRSMLDAVCEQSQSKRASITFNYAIDKNGELKNGEPWSPCDPRHTDQLLGGWMRAQTGQLTLKRRSPLSVSAMRPLHPLLVTQYEENITFDRSEHPEQHPIRVRDANGKEMSDDEIITFLHDHKRSLPRRLWIPEQKRTGGLFVYDIAVDLKRLFRVSLNQHEPELAPEMISELRENGWAESPDGLDLICSPEKRQEIIPALAHGLINWRITSNQSRTYSPQPTLAVGISDNANRLAGAIRADLNEESERPMAVPIVEPVDRVSLFITPACKGYVTGVLSTADALDDAERSLTERLMTFGYSN